LILDFGGQTTQLIGKRIRDFEVYSEIVPGDCDIKGLIDGDVKGIILSGSPDSAWTVEAPTPDALSLIAACRFWEFATVFISLC